MMEIYIALSVALTLGPMMLVNMKRFLFKLIRPLFVKNISPNEDFDCVTCGKPLLRRYLACSEKCSTEMDLSRIEQ
jgi:hypothetical protein